MKLTKQQENCPYCHEPYKPFISTGIENDLDLDSFNGPMYEVISNVLGKGHITETTLGIINVLKVPNCPFCRRPLNEEEE